MVKVAPALDRVGDFRAFLGGDFNEAFTYAALRTAESVGRPVGSAEWLADMQARTGVALKPARRGPKPRAISGCCACHRNASIIATATADSARFPAR